ncbi:hypothetical protein [uncultured Piscinibacter sp.]|uniref:hypothetical protein n=1 Tax=uncultured Piscinibacter sp. TaxID=1131835 RepID=UPI002629AF5B|nr:hypothetical protein [uncultured Piscinibacter sp.]
MNSSVPVHEASTLAADAAQLIDRATGTAGATAHRGLDAVLEGTDRLRSTVRHAGDSASDYIRHDPLKAVLMAAAAGALLTALISLMARSRA